MKTYKAVYSLKKSGKHVTVTFQAIDMKAAIKMFRKLTSKTSCRIVSLSEVR